ncbi:hypothetical protein MMC16_005454 [Acarospora aff. strigata]|nr:hypothetical protein [Acarospora aff. strigata]
MPTPLDRALQSRSTFLAFTGIVTAVAAWSIWGSDIFPAEKDPTGGLDIPVSPSTFSPSASPTPPHLLQKPTFTDSRHDT